MARDYKKEYANYHSQPAQKKNRAMRNAARRTAAKNGTVKKGDGKDVHHVKPIAKGGKNTPGNTRAVAASKNRSFARDSKARMK